jgi:hypothetical protein
MGGEDFNLESDEEILSINSPKGNIKGPYSVVHKNISERWAVAALDWDESPRLAIRWFWSENGMPNSHGYPTWFVIPPGLVNGMLNTLPLDTAYRRRLDDYLCGIIQGKDIKA